jgi:cyanophycin synthetase
MNEDELTRAVDIATQVSTMAIVEEELVGPVYRATVVDGKFAAALRRDPPHVVGDGVHTIEQLIETANEHPARSGPYFSKLKIDDAAREELSWKGYAPQSIPAAGQFVYLHQKVNWGLGGTTADATDEVHPDNIALFERASAELKAPIVGIDFIIGDISKSWKEQDRCGILECNSMPFFDNHHLPFEGEPRNVAARIWDMNGA